MSRGAKAPHEVWFAHCLDTFQVSTFCDESEIEKRTSVKAFKSKPNFLFFTRSFLNIVDDAHLCCSIALIIQLQGQWASLTICLNANADGKSTPWMCAMVKRLFIQSFKETPDNNFSTALTGVMRQTALLQHQQQVSRLPLLRLCLWHPLRQPLQALMLATRLLFNKISQHSKLNFLQFCIPLLVIAIPSLHLPPGS